MSITDEPGAPTAEWWRLHARSMSLTRWSHVPEADRDIRHPGARQGMDSCSSSNARSTPTGSSTRPNAAAGPSTPAAPTWPLPAAKSLANRRGRAAAAERKGAAGDAEA